MMYSEWHAKVLKRTKHWLTLVSVPVTLCQFVTLEVSASPMETESLDTDARTFFVNSFKDKAKAWVKDPRHVAVVEMGNVRLGDPKNQELDRCAAWVHVYDLSRMLDSTNA